VIHLDTHVLAWLYQDGAAALPERVKTEIETRPLGVSPMALLELEYLHEIGRIVPSAAEIMAELSRALELRVCDRPFHDVVAQALGLRWTRDPFDRLIVAQAICAGATLVTKDQRIRARFAEALWE